MSDTILGYGKSEFVLPFVMHLGGRMASHQEIMDNTSVPVAVSGITKTIIPDLARRRGLDWYYIDSGYLGNGMYKVWFRVTKNAYQNAGAIQNRSNLRLRHLRLDRTRYKRGRSIMLVPPDAKVADTFRLGSAEQWTTDMIHAIKQHTDRPVTVRQRPPSRALRQTSDRFIDVLQQDINAVVTYNSNCAVEAAMHGIPVVCLGESAAASMAQPLAQIDSLQDLDADHIDAWLRHLSYCQFTKREMQSGACWRILHG